MGKGVSFMESIPDYHGKPASGDKLEEALKELGGDMALFESVLEARKGPLPKGRSVKHEAAQLDPGTPHTYTKEDKKDNRGAFGKALGKALAEVGELNHGKAGATPIIVFDCDLAGSVKVDGFAKVCPDEFIEAGIQEHTTATAAGAASSAGVVAVWADFGVFASDEVYNQQRLNDVNRAGIKTVLTHSGLDVGEDGMTHQCIDYVGLFRNTFQTDRATRWMLTQPGNVCLAMGRSVLPVVLKEDGTPFFGGDYEFAPFFGGDYEFRDGAIDVLRDGKDVTILTMGHLAGRAVEAAEALAKEGISAKVLHCATPLTMDAEKLFELVGSTPLLTAEDHHADTGIGAIAALAFARAGKAVKIKNLGVTRYGFSGPNKEVLADMGLCAERRGHPHAEGAGLLSPAPDARRVHAPHKTPDADSFPEGSGLHHRAPEHLPGLHRRRMRHRLGQPLLHLRALRRRHGQGMHLRPPRRHLRPPRGILRARQKERREVGRRAPHRVQRALAR